MTFTRTCRRAILLFTFALLSCSSPYPRQDPTGEPFPSVEGASLAEKTWSLPADWQGQQVIVLIGFVQEAQFDIDRWLIGLDMKQVQAPIFEIPAIDGLVPTLIQERIDRGMKRGIPSDIWKAVITLYGDAGKKIQQFFGNQRPNSARVVLLGKQGTIRWFHDEGFSVPALGQLIGRLGDGPE